MEARTALMSGATLAVLLLVTYSTCDRPPGDGDILNLSNNATMSEYPAVACNPQGDVAVVWSDSADGDEDIWLVERKSGFQWTQPVQVSNSNLPSRSTAVALEADGTLHVAWSQYVLHGPMGGWVIVYKSRSGSQWAVAETVARGLSFEPRLALGPGGRVHMLFQDISSEACYAYKDRGGTWSPVEVVGKQAYLMYAVLSVDAAGRCYAAWNGFDTLTAQSFLMYSVKPLDSAWSAPSLVLETQHDYTEPALACRGTDSYLAFSWITRKTGLGLVRFAPETGWGELDTSCPSRATAWFGLTVDAGGDPFVIWGSSGLQAAWKTLAGWKSFNISDTMQPATRCLAVADEQGNVHLVWDTHGSSYSNEPDVYYLCVRRD
jgi:hypothetical protein